MSRSTTLQQPMRKTRAAFDTEQLPEIHRNAALPPPTTPTLDITVDSPFTADDHGTKPTFTAYSAPALKDAVWMAPDGDGWTQVYGDGDGWPVWDVEQYVPAISYDGIWAVPDGDGWSPFMPQQD